MKISVDDVLMMINPARNPAWKKALSLCIVLLFWEQTEIEKISRKTMYANNMGYNQADAPAATAWSKKILANFNPNDPLSEIMDMPSELMEQLQESTGVNVITVKKFTQTLKHLISDLWTREHMIKSGVLKEV